MCDEAATRRDAWRLLSIGLWIGLLAVLFGALLPDPSFAGEPSMRPGELRQVREVVAAVEPVWTIHWQAKTSENGGQFRLYGGADDATLRLVDIQRAAAGPGGYRFRHATAGFAWSFYQLRYVTSGGRELVLANLWVHQVGLREAPGYAAQAPSAGGKALLEASLPLTSTRGNAALPRDDRMGETRRPEPEVPPPRAAA